MAEHSKFSPSSFHRILACPAAFQETQKVAKEKSSVYARAGTLKHEIFTQLWPHYVTQNEADMRSVFNLAARMSEQDKELHEQMPWSTEDEQHVLSCCDYVKAQLITCGPNATIELEQKVNLEIWGLPDVWGTADVIIHDPDNKRLFVDDHKFGQGVPVYAQDNPQLLTYLAGAAARLPDVSEYSLTCCIIQPPLEIYSDFTIDAIQLKTFVDMLRLGIGICNEANPPYLPSTNTCKFCPARNNCRARFDLATQEAQAVFEIAKRLPDVSVSEKSRLAGMLANLEQVKKTLYADLQATIMDGTSVPGWKLVAGRSIRKWTNEEAAMRWLMKSKGIEEDDMFTSKFISPSKAEKLDRTLKKDDEFKKLVIKPMGKPQLVPESDKRKDYDINATAENVFTKQPK